MIRSVEQDDGAATRVDEPEDLSESALRLPERVSLGREMPEGVEDGAVTIGEIASTLAGEEEDLRVPERRVEPDGELVLDALRAEPVRVEPRAT